MIKEDYVSLETAKLLKEKGFDARECQNSPRYYYNTDGQFSGPSWDTEYTAPTLQMAMKWLREVHGIHINVFRYPAAFLGDNNEQHKPWWFQYTLLKPIKEIDIDSHMINDEFESAEEAMDYAIKYCLENLI